MAGIGAGHSHYLSTGLTGGLLPVNASQKKWTQRCDKTYVVFGY